MRLLFVADGRSPIALNWIRYWVERGDEVHLVSTFPCQPHLPVAGLYFIPTAFSGMKTGSARAAPPGGTASLWGAAFLGIRLKLRHWVGPITLPGAARRLRRICDSVRPQMIHAMRVPYEGMLATLANPTPPLVISIWGNDFTLHAVSTPLMEYLTHQTMRRADALHADCQRDVRLAIQWGFDARRPNIVLPGNGGIRADIFFPPAEPPASPRVINPRGFRNYVRNDTFFKSIPLILARKPETRFICPNMAGEAQAERWLSRLGITSAVALLPRQTPMQMAEQYRNCQVLVSPSTHDGTPNTLLEGMACGCYPVAGDLESLREWITPGVNGQLTDPSDPQALAQSVLEGLEDASRRAAAAHHNSALIAQRAEYGRCMQQAEEFYRQVSS